MLCYKVISLFNPFNMTQNNCILDNVTLISIFENNRHVMYLQLA